MWVTVLHKSQGLSAPISPWQIVTVTTTDTIILVEIAQNINRRETITIDSLLISALQETEQWQ